MKKGRWKLTSRTPSRKTKQTLIIRQSSKLPELGKFHRLTSGDADIPVLLGVSSGNFGTSRKPSRRSESLSL